MAGVIPIGVLPVESWMPDEATLGSLGLGGVSYDQDMEEALPASDGGYNFYGTDCPVPQSTYQLGAGTSFDAVRSALPEIAADGFDAIQFAPLHVAGNKPFVRDGVVKRGSVYAPVDYESIAPYAYKVSIEEFLDGPRTRYPEADGWTELSRFVRDAHEAGIKHVVGDMVFAHSHRSPETVAKFRAKFGPDVYQRDASQPDGIALRSGLESTGKAGPWFDAAPFDFAGPSGPALLAYQTGIMMRYVRAGVTGFRFDAAQHLLEGGHLGKLVTNVRRQAAAEGYGPLFFYAEVLGPPPDVVLRAINEGKVDAVNTSIHWWGFNRPWYVEQHNNYMAAGAHLIGFPTNADTDVLHGQDLLRQTLVAGTVAPYTYFQGAHEGRKTSVFLPEVVRAGGLDIYFNKDNGESPVRKLLRAINQVKRDEPVFARELPLNMQVDGALVFLGKVDWATRQWAVTVVHRGSTNDWQNIEVPFQGARAVFANNGHVGVIEPGEGVKDFWLAPGGAVVFYRPLDTSAREAAARAPAIKARVSERPTRNISTGGTSAGGKFI